MKKYLIIIISVVVFSLFFGYHNRVAIARQFNLRVIANSPGNNGTSTSALLRYVSEDGTTTPLQFSTHNQTQVAVAISAHASGSPATAFYLVEYGITVPVPGSNDVTIDWFRRAVPILGPELGYFSVSTTSIATTEYASSTPLMKKQILTQATTSDIFLLPTFMAEHMRISASMKGSPGVFWISPIVKDDIGN